jgi:hypothetical protein
LIYVSRVASLPDQKPHGLKVATFNAQSVGANCSEKRTEISSFVLDHDLDLMFLVETWLKARGDEAVCADLAPSGYAVKSLPRPAGRGGGLAVVYRDSLAPHLTFKSSFPFDHSSFELLQVTLTSSHKVLHFMCVYRPWPTSKNKLTEVMFFDQFPELLDYCNSLHGHVCLLGDFNFHVDVSSDRSACKFLDFIHMYNLHQTVTGPTHRHGHTLDLVIERPSDGVHQRSEVTRELESDHICVLAMSDMLCACVPYRA